MRPWVCFGLILGASRAPQRLEGPFLVGAGFSLCLLLQVKLHPAVGTPRAPLPAHPLRLLRGCHLELNDYDKVWLVALKEFIMWPFAANGPSPVSRGHGLRLQVGEEGQQAWRPGQGRPPGRLEVKAGRMWLERKASWVGWKRASCGQWGATEGLEMRGWCLWLRLLPDAVRAPVVALPSELPAWAVWSLRVVLRWGFPLGLGPLGRRYPNFLPPCHTGLRVAMHLRLPWRLREDMGQSVLPALAGPKHPSSPRSPQTWKTGTMDASRGREWLLNTE